MGPGQNQLSWGRWNLGILHGKSMKNHTVSTKKAVMLKLFKNDEPHPKMGNLSAISVLKSINPAIFSPETCIDLVLRSIHRDKADCPRCGSSFSEKNRAKFFTNQQVYCPNCKKKSHATTGTPIAGSSISAEQIVCMALLFVVGFSDAQVAKTVSSNHHTVKKWRILLSAE
jgi:transposase-like protein